MSNAIVVPSGAGDVLAFSGPATVVGYCVRESAGAPAVAAVTLRDGLTVAGPVRAFFELAANESKTGPLPAIEFAAGVFVDREAGSTELVIYTQ